MLRFALFGAGRAGTIHARNIANHPRAQLVCAFDIDQAASQRLTAACGGRVAASQQEIWEADDVDAVLIASSTDTHVDLLRQAMRTARPTYCEKPIDLNIDKVRMVVAEAARLDPPRKRPTVAWPCFIGFRRRFLPEFQQMRRSIGNGAIGRLETIHIIARDFEPPSAAYLRRSGGFLRDKMIHYFDLAPWLAAERPAEVYASGSCLVDPAIGQAGDIDTAMVLLRFGSGALCVIENSRRAIYGCDERIEVFGAKGMLQSRPTQTHQLAHFTQTGIAQSGFPEVYGQESFAAALDAFITAVESGAAVAPSLQDGFQAQLIAEAAVESLHTNLPVAIPYDL